MKIKLVTVLSALIFLIVLNFILPRLLPGDPLLAIYGEEASLSLSEEMKAELISEMGLNQSLPVQFGRYIGALARGDLGYSYSLNAPVRAIIARTLPWTALLVGTALLLSTLSGVVLGIESGWRKGHGPDRSILLMVIMLSGLPNFLVGVLLLLLFSVQLHWFPLGGAVTPYSGLTGAALAQDVARHLVLPALSLAVVQLSETFMVTRSAMLGNITAPYVLTAAGKGLKKKVIQYRHAGRNSLLPVSARLGVAVGRALTGALFVEIVFAYPGMGLLIHQALLSRDYPLLQGIFLVMALIIIIANILADRLAFRLDPRLREG
jgi:peptide/nickel transport system permease protein